jgi:membrane protease YdiL (CAAX protease family)
VGADGKNAGAKCRPWFGLFIGVATVIFVRLRGAIPGYQDMRLWLHNQGVDSVLGSLDGALLMAIGAWLGARLAMQEGSVLRALGLRASPLVGLVVGVVASLPMVVQAAISHAVPPWSNAILRNVIVMPFAEELLFRGLLVVMPVACGRLPFWPCAVFSGVAFGSLHVPWSPDVSWDDAPVFAVTAIGGIWFAWLCRSFRWNLWVPIVMHGVMNAHLFVFDVEAGAAGSLWPNVGRGLTIALATVLAVRHSRRAGATTT